mgnify:CR=1 FL=1
MSDYSVIPPTGEYGNDWPDNHVLPQGKGGSISQAGWTEESQGFPQQTFLGASIRSFNISAGFGDTSSQLSVDLVNDEYNTSDGLPPGQGDDVYHSGLLDTFRPPVVGTPVYFKFGKNFATIDQAYRKTLDDTYNESTIPSVINFPTVTTTGDIAQIPGDNYFLRDTTGTGANAVHTWVDKSSLLDTTNNYRGKDHFVFGGILQSYTQTKGPNGNPLYSLNVTDPREILSNASVILNNYQGTTFNNKNLFNVYGFLEYDVSDELKEEIEGTDVLPNTDLESKNILTKNVDAQGIITYTGDDTYSFNSLPFSINNFPPSFPITGQGFARRGDQGIPWYRVNQALTALFGFNGALPDEYVNAGFGGTIDFRGYKYVVDFTGIPLEKIPQMYFMAFDQLTLMDLAQELADVISHDLFVSLLPVIDHPAYSWLYNLNQYNINNGNTTNVIAGVIRIDAIDRSVQPDYGSIKSYIDGLAANGIEVENQDVGFELSNVTTDKFVVGANEVDMFYFTNHRDRNNLQLRRKNNGLPNDFELLEETQWDLETSLKQQILPFYGFLGKSAVTIPRGFGSYQQILLDTSKLNAYGVGNYYIATELELRNALKSYEDWCKFLADYSELYIEDLSADKQFYKGYAGAALVNLQDDASMQSLLDKYTETSDRNRLALEAIKNGNYGVTVPRCLFNSDKDFMGNDGYPASPCSPPYGYPLYYKRAEKIGIAKAASVSFGEPYLKIQSNFEEMKKRIEEKVDNGSIVTQDDGLSELLEDIISGTIEDIDISSLSPESLKNIFGQFNEADTITKDYKNFYQLIGQTVKSANVLKSNSGYMAAVADIGLDGEKNAKKVYGFIKRIAEENLGKKFLVKIPKACNLSYDTQFEYDDSEVEIEKGPFGFKPQPINFDAGYSSSTEFNIEISGLLTQIQTIDVNQGTSAMSSRELFNHYLDKDAKAEYTYGALKNNYNPVSEKWEFNYQPATNGGFFNFALHNRNLSFTESSALSESELPLSTQFLLAPKDLSTIVDYNGRMKCYVRYDNSQFLDMSSVSKDKIVQQSQGDRGFIPDIMEELENTNPDHANKMKMNRVLGLNGIDTPKTVTFVSCDIDAQLYMCPKPLRSQVTVYGRNVEYVANERPLEFIEESSGCYKPIIEDQYRIYSPSTNGGSDGTVVENTDFQRTYNAHVDAHLINTEKENLDPDHVYALITIPGRIKPIIDSRYNDAELYAVNAPVIKHNLTQDVVRGPQGFEKPAPAVNRDEFTFDCPLALRDFNSLDYMGITNAEKAKTLLNWQKQEFKQFNAGIRAQREAMSSASLGNADFNASKSQPSPIYPDLVAMPLLSNERCYGPWMSASIIDSNASVRYSNIGGKVEFVKDENLAPWNFAGYQLMNEAGSLQAQFSNSLLLFGEKGSFSMPEAPTGLSIAAALKAGGPLITSINVSVGDSSIRTSVNMDLYTSRFGKLQKQKEELIGKISRERQKIIDQNNSMVRQGIGKSFSNVNLAAPLLQTGEILERAAEDMDTVFNQLMSNQTVSFKSRTDVKSARDTDGNPKAKLDRKQSAANVVDSETIAGNLSSSERHSLQDKRFNKRPNDDTEIVSTDGRSSSQFIDGEGMDNIYPGDISDLLGEQIA